MLAPYAAGVITFINLGIALAFNAQKGLSVMAFRGQGGTRYGGMQRCLGNVIHSQYMESLWDQEKRTLEWVGCELVGWLEKERLSPFRGRQGKKPWLTGMSGGRGRKYSWPKPGGQVEYGVKGSRSILGSH